VKHIFRLVFFSAVCFIWISLFGLFDYVDQESFFSEYTLSELSISSVAEKIGQTKTIAGKEFFQTMLLQPTTNIDLINKRQSIINYLSNDDKLYFSIKKELDIIAKNESSFAIYQDKNHRFHTDVRRLVPINPVLKKALSGSPLLLECFYLALFGDASLGLIKQFGLLGFLKELVLFRDGSMESMDFFRAISYGFGETIKQHNIFQTQKATTKEGKPFGLALLIYTGYINNLYKALVGLPYMPRIFAGFLSVMPAIYYDFKLVEAMSESYKNSSEIIAIMQELQEYLVSFSSYFSAYNRLRELIEKSNLGRYGLLKNAKNIEANKSLLNGIIALQSSTFDQKRKYAFYHGKALCVHLMLSDNIGVVNNTLNDIAELDVYIVLATLIREQTKEKPFCFVKFVELAEPTIHATESWIPFTKSPIKDDIILRQSLSKIVLTGPNGSGKSIYLKKIGIIICMAQTFGIAPAETCEMTIFSYVRTALDCKGDTEKGYSKFTQQRAMMQSFVDLAQSTINTRKRAIFLIDEAFSGTVEDEAGKRVLQFLDQVNDFDYAIFVVSTHLEDPVYQRPTKSRFVPYCLKVHVVEDSTQKGAVRFEKTFHCEPGIMEWWFGDPYLRAPYIEQN